MGFAKDRTKSSGLDRICRACRKAYRAKNKDKELARWKRNYAPGSEQRRKHIVRSQTRKKYGSARKHVCSCGNPATEWHHIKYEIDSVVALCHECHEGVSQSRVLPHLLILK
jgi:hypothetical protein